MSGKKDLREHRDHLAAQLDEVRHVLAEAMQELPEVARITGATPATGVRHLVNYHRFALATALRAPTREATKHRSAVQVGLHLLHQFLDGWKGGNLGEGIRRLAEDRDRYMEQAGEAGHRARRLEDHIQAMGDPLAEAEMERLSDQLDKQAATHRLQLRAHEDASRAAYAALADALGPTSWYVSIPDGIRKLAQMKGRDRPVPQRAGGDTP